MSDARTVTFRKLKPACVVLSKAALGARSTGRYGPDVVEALQGLRKQLLEAGTMDAELASYAFFPLSHVFHGLKTLPLPVLHLSLECLRALIAQGWTQSREAGLCKQLLVLLSFIIEPAGSDSQKGPDYGDVATTHALECFAALFGEASALVQCLCSTEAENPVPVLGQAFSAALTAMNGGTSLDVQVAASLVLVRIVECLRDEPLLRNFFPGVVSGFTRYLQPRANARKPAKALAHAVTGLDAIIAACYQDPEDVSDDPAQDDQESKWRAQQAPQLQKALAQTLKLKDHDREEVLQALFLFCSHLLLRCRAGLGDILQLTVDVFIYLSSSDQLSPNPRTADTLDQTLTDESLSDALRKSLQGWLTALPRVAQAGEPERLERHLTLISTAYNLLNRIWGDQAELAKLLVASVEQASAIALQESSAGSKQPIETSLHESTALTLAVTKDIGTTFQQIGRTRKGQGKTLAVLEQGIRSFSESSLIRDEIAARPPTLESLWVAKTALRTNSSLIHRWDEDFITTLSNNNGPATYLAEALYTQSLDILSESVISPDSDWRKQATALEVVALTAQAQGPAFAPELIDILFPVLERIGSSELELREHALACLNVLAGSCGAESAGQLIIQNADYLVNAVAQRISVPEISPQTPKVLVMVIHLCGPSLVSYLDDTMTSVFEILDDYHGYYSLVDSLFAVLEAVVSVASAPSSKLLEGRAQTHRVEVRTALSMSDVKAAIEKLRKRNDSSEADSTRQLAADIPDHEDQDSSEMLTATKGPKPGPTKPYQMVQSITRHCQHYLTHSSPDLRRRLLSLISTASLALYRSEDQYLPLINDIWPVVVTRLHDEEPLVVQAAMETIATLCQCAGDFMLTRMRDAWPDILAVGKRLKAEADARNKGKGGRGSFGLTVQMVESFVGMLSYLTESTGLSPKMEDDIFDTLGPYHAHHSVHQLLDAINADALWLLELEKGDADSVALNESLPTHSGFIFQEINL